MITERLYHMKLPTALRAFRHRNYRLFFSGQLISLIGTWMQMIAEAWLVYRLTGSATLLGFAGFAARIPVFLFASVGGSLADKFDRRTILVFTQITAMILAFILAGLTLTNTIQIWHIFVLAALLGFVNAVDMPTRQAFVVDMVAREDMAGTIAMNSSMVNGARIIGPAVAGVLVASVGEGWCFFINAVSYIGVITGLLMMRMEARVAVPSHDSAFSSIIEGFRYVWRTGPIRALLLILGVVSLMGMPYVVLMPIFADQILHGGARGLGILMGTSGAGALIGALTLASRKSLRGLGHWIAYASTGFGVGLILFALSRSFWISTALLLPIGFSMMIMMASSNTLIQTLVPDHLRGRIMAIYSMMFIGMAPFGSLFAGTLADYLGAPPVVMIGGTACIFGAVLFWRYLPVLRREARKMTATQPDIGVKAPAS